MSAFAYLFFVILFITILNDVYLKQYIYAYQSFIGRGGHFNLTGVRNANGNSSRSIVIIRNK